MNWSSLSYSSLACPVSSNIDTLLIIDAIAPTMLAQRPRLAGQRLMNRKCADKDRDSSMFAKPYRASARFTLKPNRLQRKLLAIAAAATRAAAAMESLGCDAAESQMLD